MKYQQFISLFFFFLFVFSSSYAQVSNDEIDLANRAYQLNQYEEAWKSYQKLKQKGLKAIDGESIDQKIDLCEEILTLTSYAKARVLYRQRKFDEAIKVLEKDYCKGMSEVDAFRHLCETAKKEMTKPNPRFIFTEETKSILQKLSKYLFEYGDPAIISALNQRESLVAFWDDDKNKGGYLYLSFLDKLIKNKTELNFGDYVDDISADYNVVTPFHEGLALVRKGKQWHYINSKNQIIIRNVGNFDYYRRKNRFDFSEPEPGFYSSTSLFTIHTGPVKRSLVPRVMGNQNFDNAFFSEGLAVVSDEMGYQRIIDKEGNIILDHIYDDYYLISGFVNGYARVNSSEEDSWGLPKQIKGLIDKNGRIIIPCQYYYLTDCGSDLVGFQKNNYPDAYFPKGTGGYGFINLKNEIVIPQKYQYVTAFHEGLAAVELNGKWGYIDSIGNTIIPFVFDDSDSFGQFLEGYAHVRVGNKDGFIDHFGFSTLDSIIYGNDDLLSQHDRIIKEIHNLCPIIVTGIQFSYDINGNSESSDRIKGDKVTYIRPIVSYHGIINTECNLDVKWYTPDYSLKDGSDSPNGYSYSTTKAIERGDHDITLSGWGNDNPGTWSQKGEYIMELWYNGRLLKTKTLNIF